MLTKLSKIMNKTTKFTHKHNIEMEFHLYTVEDLNLPSENQDANWATFQNSAGLFCIFDNNSNKLKKISINSKGIGSPLYRFLNKDEEGVNNKDIVLVIVIEEDYMLVTLKDQILTEITKIEETDQ